MSKSNRSRHAKQDSASKKAAKSKPTVAALGDHDAAHSLKLTIDDVTHQLSPQDFGIRENRDDVEGLIRKSSECVIALDALVYWSAGRLKKLVFWLQSRGLKLKFSVESKTYNRLPNGLAAVAKLCTTPSRRMKLVAAVKLAYSPDANDSTRLANAVDAVVNLHRDLDLAIPTKPALTREIRDLASKSVPSGPAITSEDLATVFAEDNRVANLVVPEDCAITTAGVYLKNELITKTPLLVVAVFDEVLTGQQKYLLLVRDGTRVKTCCVAASNLMNVRSIIMLADEGIDVSSETAQQLVIYLQLFLRVNREILPRSRVHEQLGYQEVTIDQHGKLVKVPVFQFGKAILTPQAFDDVRDEICAQLRLEPRDQGEADYLNGIQQRGSWKTWRKMLIQTQKWPVVQLGVILALMPMALKHLGIRGFAWSLAGHTSSGKTSALRIAASVVGVPDIFPDGVILDFNATPNSLQRFLVVSNDFPTFLDETTLWRDRPDALQALIYQIASGKGKSRATIKGAEASPAYRTVAHVTGEASLLELCAQQGTLGRVLEVRELPFGGETAETDAEREDAVRIASENCGHAGPRFVQYLLDHPEVAEQLPARQQALLQEERGYAPNGEGLMSRIAAMLAATRAVFEVMKLALKLPQDFADPIAALRKSIYDAIQTSNKFDEALESLSSYVQEHKERFHQRSTGSDGFTDDENGQTILYILRPVLKRLLDERCQLSIEAVLQVWAKEGKLIIKDKRRFTVRKKFAGRMQELVAVRIGNTGVVYDADADLAASRSKDDGPATKKSQRKRK